VSRRYLSAADLVLLCVEMGQPFAGEDSDLSRSDRVLLVRTKSDLDGEAAPEAPDGGLRVSAVTGEGLDALRRAAGARVFGDRIALADLEPALSRARHRTALARAQGALADARAQLLGGGDAVLVAHHVRDATTALDELIGAVDIEDILDRVFASFCIGK
jgi:tRNA modification GTPase